jgi:glycosyltransferase involved in cell wall biosynthesis
LSDARILPVSLVIPVAGRPKLVVEALESVLIGTARPAQILVVVDSLGDIRSADARAVSDFREQHTIELKILFSEGVGAAGARNVGARQAREPYLAFLDSDDIWHADKLERQWSYMRKRPHLHASQTGERWWKAGRYLKQPNRLRPRPGRFLRDAWRVCLISLSSTLIRRDTFFELGAFDENYPACEDFELWLRYLVRAPFGLVPEALVTKRSGGWPQLSARHSLDALRIRAILKTVRQHALDPGERERARVACMEKLAFLKQGAARRGQPDRHLELAREIDVTFGAGGSP